MRVQSKIYHHPKWVEAQQNRERLAKLQPLKPTHLPQRVPTSWFHKHKQTNNAITKHISKPEVLESTYIVEEFAYTDPLTGFGNRRMFFERLENDLALSTLMKQDVSVLVISIDHFDKIHTTYGETTTEEIFRMIGKLIKECLAPGDALTRLGKEEYGIILPQTPEHHALWVAEHICHKVSKQVFDCKHLGESLTCTVSIGVAGGNNTKENQQAHTLYNLADARLYVAKITHNQVYWGEVY